MSGVGSDGPVRRNRGPVRQGRPGTPWSARGLVLVIDTMLVGVGGVFIATRSVLVTTIAAVSALALTAVILRAAPSDEGR